MAGGWRWGLLLVLAIALLAAYGSLSLQVSSATHVFLDLAPKLGLTLLAIFAGKVVLDVLAQLIGNVVRPPELRRTVRDLVALAVWLLVSLAILAVFIGDMSALLIAVGLIGFGLTFSLQKPILSFVGWFAIVSQRIYKEGDMVEIEGIKGDVVAVGLLTTTIRSAGEEEGKAVVLPNLTVLEHPVTNYTQDFPYVWDEVSLPLPEGADAAHLKNILLGASDEIIGNRKMAENAKEYVRLLQGSGVAVRKHAPEVLFSLRGDGAVLTLRYIVQVRQRESVKSALSARILKSLREKSAKRGD